MTNESISRAWTFAHFPLAKDSAWNINSDTAVLTLTSCIIGATFALLLGAIWTVFYRRFFHPLAKVPGPFWSSISTLPSFYHNSIRNGQWYKEVARLHQVYGPIIRIGPNEIHLDDPDHYETIYGNASNFYKDRGFYAIMGMEEAMFSTIPNDLHRSRRTPLNPFFSKKAILECEDVVHDKVEKLCRRIQQAANTNEPIDLSRAFRALSVDVVTDYSFNNPMNLLDQDDFGAWFANMLREASPMFWIFQQFPILATLLQSMPPSLSRKLSSSVDSFERLLAATKVQVVNVKEDIANGVKPQRKTIFHTLLDADAAEGRRVRSTQNLADEAMSITSAAADSTGNAMSYAVWSVMSNPEVKRKVTEELRAKFPDPNSRLDLVSLEQLPYLTGVVKEAQRMSYGVIGRLPRVSPDGGAFFDGHYVPSGTVVSMSTWSMHHNTDAFPDPDKFDPSRWMDPEGARLRDKCFVPFSKGRRMCLGHTLAICELYCTIGTVLRRFDQMEVYKVTAEDMVYEDYLGAVHPLEANSFRVLVRQ